MAYPEIFVLRHGETEWNASGRMQGRLHSPLTPKGVAQAERQRMIMAGLGRSDLAVLTSPQARALHSAALIFAQDTAMIRTDDRLCEIDVGSWQGRLRSELRIEGPPKMTSDGPIAFYEQAKDGEGFAALRARCSALLDTLEGPTALVTHGITSRMLRAVYLGLDDAAIAELPGGQGVVHHLREDAQEILR